MVYDVVQQVFNGPIDRGFNRSLAIDVFVTGRITEQIVEGQRRSDEAQTNKNMRLGYMGHLTLIAEEVVKFTGRHPPEVLSQAVMDRVLQPDWVHYVEHTLSETRERDNAVLGGERPERDSGLSTSQGLTGSTALANAGLNGGSGGGFEGFDYMNYGSVSSGAFGGGSNSMLSGFGSSSDDEDEDMEDHDDEEARGANDNTAEGGSDNVSKRPGSSSLLASRDINGACFRTTTQAKPSQSYRRPLTRRAGHRAPAASWLPVWRSISRRRNRHSKTPRAKGRAMMNNGNRIRSSLRGLKMKEIHRRASHQQISVPTRCRRRPSHAQVSPRRSRRPIPLTVRAMRSRRRSRARSGFHWRLMMTMRRWARWSAPVWDPR